MRMFIAKAQALWATRERRDRGATAVEYGLMIALIAGVIIGTVVILGGQVNQTFVDVCNAIGGAGTC